MAVFDYPEGFYNPRRRHSALGYLSPGDLSTEPGQLHVATPTETS